MLGKKSPVGPGSPRTTSTNMRRRRTFRVLHHRIDTRRRVNLESGSRSGTPAAQSVNAIDPGSGLVRLEQRFCKRAVRVEWHLSGHGPANPNNPQPRTHRRWRPSNDDRPAE